VTDSFLTENIAINGGAIRNAGGVITVTHSTLSDNSASIVNSSEGVGGAISNVGSLKVTNSTLSNNHADAVGAAIHSWISNVIVDSSTLSGNSASLGGTLSNNYNPMTVTNSIVSSYPFGIDCTGSDIIDGGHNISSDDTCGFSSANGSMPNTDPKLGPLQDNSGSTLTHALLEGSPAIDAGDDTQCPPTDQRGIPRPQDGNGDGEAICDIGSYELEALLNSPSLVTLSGPGEGMIYQTYPFTATVGPITTTLLLTYTWQASGQAIVTRTNGLTDTVSYTWEVLGMQVITVTASNQAGSVMDTQVITITDVPVSGLVASNDSPTLLGEATALSATITSGTNVIYTWDFGDESDGSGRIITHNYSSIGEYTATITATNSTTTLADTTNVTIICPIYPIYLPLVNKSVETPLGSIHSSSSPKGVVFWD
jgi:hypothetical protein